MTKLLEEAILLVRALPEDQQDELAARIIAELTDDADFDRTIAATASRLDRLIDEALTEDDAGLTRQWPERAR